MISLTIESEVKLHPLAVGTVNTSGHSLRVDCDRFRVRFTVTNHYSHRIKVFSYANKTLVNESIFEPGESRLFEKYDIHNEYIVFESPQRPTKPPRPIVRTGIPARYPPFAFDIQIFYYTPKKYNLTNNTLLNHKLQSGKLSANDNLEDGTEEHTTKISLIRNYDLTTSYCDIDKPVDMWYTTAIAPHYRTTNFGMRPVPPRRVYGKK